MKPKSSLLGGAAALTILALLLLLGTTDTVHAGTFNPTLSIKPAQPTAGASSDFTADFNLPAGDVNFAGLVAFIPGDWGITPGDEIPIGAVVGQLNTTATLGLINGPCANELPVSFTMLNASIDITDTVEFDDTDPVAGEPGYDPSNPGNDIEQFAEDNSGDGLQDSIDKYPEFITRVLTDENDQPLKPIRRSAGISVVAGVNVLLQFLVFEPGTFVNRNIPNDVDLGHPSVTLLQDIGDPENVPEPGTITDFCTPLISSNTTFGISKDNACTDDVPKDQLDPVCETTSAPIEVTGEGGTNPDEGGVALGTNPAEGTYTFTTVALGQRDADGDGWENSFDVCPFTANDGDPHIGGDGDSDSDGLDAACDPNDNDTNSDQDLDGYPNRQDNCPLISNGENEADIPDVGNQEDNDLDEDGEDAPDQIGDACDTNPDSPDGELLRAVLTEEVTIGPGEPGAASPTPSGGGDDNGGSSGTTIIIIVAVIAGVVVVGGGAFVLMRRRGGGGGGGATA